MWDRVFPLLNSVHHFREVDSTNDLAKRWVGDQAEPTPAFALVADRQTRGRGRGANAWWSDEGSLTFSVVLDPRDHGLVPAVEPRVALAAGLSLLRGVETYIGSATIGVRWPNDVEVDGRKLAGILVERVVGQNGPRLIVGIGLNLATRFDEAPPDVQRMATSMSAFEPLFERPEMRAEMLAIFLERFNFEILRIVSQPDSLAEDLNQYDLLRSESVRIELGGTVIQGIGAGIASDGALLLQVEGQMRPFHGGRILRTY